MGIAPGEFWGLCPCELNARAAGWAEQQRQETQRVRMAAWLQALWGRVKAERFPSLREALGEQGARQDVKVQAEMAAMAAGIRIEKKTERDDAGEGA